MEHWVTITSDIMLTVAVIPCDEASDHVQTSRYCRCNPRVVVQHGYTHYWHMARNHREIDELLKNRKAA